jgi:phenylpyruvate tautomerase
MPLISVYTSAEEPADEKAQMLLRELSSSLARLLGKPERYVMTNLVPRTQMTFAGTLEPACLVEIKNIGSVARDTAAGISEVVCKSVHDALGVPSNRTYVVLADIPADAWAFDGATFG